MWHGKSLGDDPTIDGKFFLLKGEDEQSNIRQAIYNCILHDLFNNIQSTLVIVDALGDVVMFSVLNSEGP